MNADLPSTPDCFPGPHTPPCAVEAAAIVNRIGLRIGMKVL